MRVNISTFSNWFLTEFIRIATNIINHLDNIELVSNVTLLDFIIAIAVISAFIGIILTLPNSANRMSSRAESKQRRAERNKKSK